jgi:hypothetical protein
MGLRGPHARMVKLTPQKKTPRSTRVPRDLSPLPRALAQARARRKPHRSPHQVSEVVQWARTYADLLIAELTREQVAGGQ